jgi:hypothetical protein
MSTTNFTFSISRTKILNIIKTNSFYRGERLKEDNGAHAARMQAGDDNDDVLKDELYTAATDIVSIITKNLATCTVVEPDPNGPGEDDKELYKFVCPNVSNFPIIELKETVQRSIRVYMADKALEGWLLINMPEEVQALGDRVVKDAEKLRQLLITRTKPVR